MIKCLFCQQNLEAIKERWGADYGCIWGHDYECVPCHARYTASMRVSYGPHFEGENVDYYTLRQDDYEIECWTYLSGSCQVKRILGPGRAAFLCHFPFIPPNLSPQTLLQRIKIWIVFS
jgi:hypothetical protein